MFKKIVSLFLVALLLLLVFSGCNDRQDDSVGEKDDGKQNEASASDSQKLYEFGLEMVKIMDEMVASEDYASVIGTYDFSGIAESIDAHDDAPVAVYALHKPKAETLFKLFDREYETLWDGLSENLKEQLEYRASFLSLISMMNGELDIEKSAFSSMYTAFKPLEDLNVEETTAYLYVFEKGTPVVVHFNEAGYANGQFFFAEDLDSLEDVQNAFEPYQCTVEKLDIE